ncbi:MAG: hypothetical protein RLZZ373_3367, partial [Pseudomonadota bacterium]
MLGLSISLSLRGSGGGAHAPSVTAGTISGSLIIAATLSLAGSSVTGADTTTYSWKINGVEYGTSATFSPDFGGSCTCTVTGTNAIGSTSATTPAVAIDPTPVVIAVGSQDVNTNGISVPWPTHKLNDIGLLLIETANETPATGSGFTSLASVGVGVAAASDATLLTLQWKRAASSSEANVSIADAGDHTFGRMISVRGCPPGSTPVTLLASQTLSVSSSPMSWIDATTTVDNTLVALVATNPEDVSSGSSFAGFSN